MQDQELEGHFSAISEDLFSLKEDVSSLKSDASQLKSSFAKMEETLKLILEIVRGVDIERREIKSTLWEHDRRLVHLERA